MRGQTVRLDGLEPTVTDFAGSHIFLFILSLRGKAEFRAGQRSRTVPKQSELTGSAAGPIFRRIPVFEIRDN